jgi:hypothetical protein
MRRRFANPDYVRQTEENVVCSTRGAFSELDWRLSWVVAEELLKLPHFSGPIEPQPSDSGSVQVYCLVNYAQFPYTLSRVHETWRKGYYLESFILIRHLIEVFAQMRFFHRHPELLQPHVTSSQTGSGRVRFVTMFDELSTNSYRLVYGDLLSTYSHGNANMIFRATLSNNEETGPQVHPVTGCEFNISSATLICIFMTNLALGFLRFFPICFPRNSISEDEEFEKDLEMTKQWLIENVEGFHKQSAQTDFHDALHQLIW